MELERNTQRTKQDTLRNIINITTVLFYILFSILKRFVENPKVMWIPAILFFANVLIICEILYMTYKNKPESEKKDIYWIAIQFIVNIGLGILCISYINDL